MKYSATMTGGLLLAVTVFLSACGGKQDNSTTAELDKAIEQIKGLEEVKTTMEKQDLSRALTVVRKYAHKGDRRAMFWITEGRTLDANDKNYISLADSLKWLEKSAGKGYADASLQLADLYASDKTIKNPEKAYYWYYIGYFMKDGKVSTLSKDQKNPVPGDFRNETGVDEVVSQLKYEKMLEIEKQAKSWLANLKKS